MSPLPCTPTDHAQNSAPNSAASLHNHLPNCENFECQTFQTTLPKKQTMPLEKWKDQIQILIDTFQESFFKTTPKIQKSNLNIFSKVLMY